jgi:alpha-mannosidase
LRPNPAGPLDPLEGPQLPGRVALDYAVLLHRGDWHDARLHEAADDFAVPLESVRGGGWPGAAAAPTGRALAITGAVVSAVLRDRDRALTVRLYNPGSAPVDATVAHGSDEPCTGEVIDLTGTRLGAFAGSVSLRAGEIVTLRIADR